jgi:hypothetical protein
MIGKTKARTDFHAPPSSPNSRRSSTTAITLYWQQFDPKWF